MSWNVSPSFYCLSAIFSFYTFSALKFVDIVIGNSSSGLLEVPSFKKATINIGDRQNGRIKASSVIDCSPNKLDIKGAIKIALSTSFQTELKEVENPYEKGNSSNEIVKVLQNINLDGLIKKKFYDI